MQKRHSQITEYENSNVSPEIRKIIKSKRITVSDFRYCVDLLNENISDKKYTKTVLSKILTSKELTIKQFSSINNSGLSWVINTLAKSNPAIFKYFHYNDNHFSAFRNAIKESSQDSRNHIAKIITPSIEIVNQNIFKDMVEATNLVSTYFKSQSDLLNDTIKKIADSVSSLTNIITPIVENISRNKDFFDNLKKAGLTPNLGDDRSLDNLNKYRKLLSMGYALFWVPHRILLNFYLIQKQKVKEEK